MNMLRILLAMACLLTVLPSESAARKLITLIPSLYGGDGIFLATDPAADHTAHFSIDTAASINRLNEQIAGEVATFPFSSPVGSFTFAFDPALATFVEVTDTLGPLFAERAPTLGRGKLNLSLSYTYISYSSFDGEDLHSLEVTAKHDADIIGFPDEREEFEGDTILIRVDLDITVQIVGVGATYGLTDRLDLGIFIPLVYVDMKVKSVAEVAPSPENTLFPDVHTFEGGPESPEDKASDDAFGLGDIVLRGKYHLIKSDVVDFAGALLVKFATGDEDNFLGTGDTTVRPFLVLSRTFSEVLPWGLSITPHLNVGYEFHDEESHQDSIEYVIGFDAGTRRFILAAEFLGSHELDGDGVGDDRLDFAVGFKWNPFERFIVAANAQIPLNDDGLRADVIPTVLLEYNF